MFFESSILRWRPGSQTIVTFISSSLGPDVVSSVLVQMETGWNIFETSVHTVKACGCSDFFYFKESGRVQVAFQTMETAQDIIGDVTSIILESSVIKDD